MMLGLQRLGCRPVRRILWDYVAERLSEGLLETVERHLAGCSACRREAESLRQAQALLSAYRRVPIVPPRSDWHAVRERLMLLPQPLPPLPHERRRSRPVLSGGLIALLLIAALGYRDLRAFAPQSHFRPAASSTVVLTQPMPPKQVQPTAALIVKNPQGQQDKHVAEPKSIPVSIIRSTNAGEMTKGIAARDSANEGYSFALFPVPFSLNSPQPQTHRQDNAASRHYLVSAKRPGGMDSSPHFRPYKRRPGDGLQAMPDQDDSNGDRLAVAPNRGTLPVVDPNSYRQVGNEGAYIMPTLQPDPHDSDSPY